MLAVFAGPLAAHAIKVYKNLVGRFQDAAYARVPDEHKRKVRPKSPARTWVDVLAKRTHVARHTKR